MFWDQLIIKHGNILTNHRRDFIEFLNQSTDFPASLCEYDPSTISEKRLHQYAIGSCHRIYIGWSRKDDFDVF
jgi:hypothetical protein